VCTWNEGGSFLQDAYPDLKADFILANPPFNDSEWGGEGLRDVAPIRETVYRRSLPLATRHLRIERSSLEDTAGVVGAAFMVIDELFSPQHLKQWIDDGSPVGRPEMGATA
jgi:hypothetical protein